MSQISPKKIRVGLFVGNRLFLNLLFGTLRKEMDIVCENLNDFSTASQNNPEVILLDCLDVTESNLKELSASFPNARIVVMNGNRPEVNLLLCSCNGVTGFTLEHSCPK